MERLLISLQDSRSNQVFQCKDSIFSGLACNLFHILQKEDAQYLRQFNLLPMRPQIFQMSCLIV